MSDTPGWSSPDQPSNQPPQQPSPQHGPPQQGPPYGYGGPPPAIKPGVIPLRPLKMGEIIDGAITTMRRYPKLLIGGAAIVAAVTQIVGLLVQLPFLRDITGIASVNQSATSEEILDRFAESLPGAIAGAGVKGLLALLGTVFLSGFITVVVGHAVLGEPVTLSQAWKEFKPQLFSLLGATLLFGLVIGGVLVVLIGLGVVSQSTLVLVLAVLVAGVAAIGLWVAFSLVTPALVLERSGVGTAFGRSRKLVNGAWWRTFGVLLVAGLLTSVIGSIIAVPFELVGLAVTGFSTDLSTLATDPSALITPVYLIMVTVGAIIASTITLPFSAAVSVLIYVDRRMRSEGMDIELQRAAGHGEG